MQNPVNMLYMKQLVNYIVGAYYNASFFFTIVVSFFFLLQKKMGTYNIYIVFLVTPLAYMLSQIIHECGHFFSGLIVGLKLYDFNIPILRIKKIHNKWKIYKNLNKHFYCHMNNEKQLTVAVAVIYLFGGILLNIMVVVLCLIYISRRCDIFTIFIFALLFHNLRSAIINGVPYNLNITNDGVTIRHLLSDYKYAQLFDIQMQANYYLEQLNSISHMQYVHMPIPNPKENDLTYYIHMLNYYISLDSGKYQQAYCEIEDMYNSINCYSHVVQDSIVIEMVFISCLLHKKSDRILVSIFNKKREKNYDYYCSLCYYMNYIGNKEETEEIRRLLNVFYDKHERNEFMRVKKKVLDNSIL